MRRTGHVHQSAGPHAEAMSREALEVQADIYEYLYSLIKERELEINRKEKWDSYVKFSKKVFLPGFVYKKISKNNLKDSKERFDLTNSVQLTADIYQKLVEKDNPTNK